MVRNVKIWSLFEWKSFTYIPEILALKSPVPVTEWLLQDSVTNFNLEYFFGGILKKLSTLIC
jgi:hypothetical protein